MRVYFIFSLVILFKQITADAQNEMFQRMNIPVTRSGQPYKSPFTGGLNNPQLSAADLNNDGIQDLVAFDRGGDVVLTYLNDNLPGEASYTFAPEYACNFPKLVDWALLRDYNKDGAADIFCGSLDQNSQEVQVFRGYFENNMLHFVPFVFSYPNCPNCNPDIIWYPDEIPGFWNNLPVSKTDIPAIDDIDGDGDLDIMAFPAGTSTNVWWWKNTSVEKGYGFDSLHYEAYDRCWGRFYENGFDPCQASLSGDPTVCNTGLAGEADDRDDAHPGATLMTYDQDGDGDKELVLGNISFDCLGMLTNTGSPDMAWMTALDDTFPIYSTPVELSNFPGSFYLDIDNDGKKDIVATRNNKTVGEDQKNVWFYKNTAATGHFFELESKNFLVSETIDFGTSTHPAFADVNGDGLLDLVVGNYGYFTPTIPPGPGTPGIPSTPNNASLYLFLNTGTPTAPVFNLVNSDWLNMSEYAPDDSDFSPAFGDIDGDGDLDLLVGNNIGALYCYRNEGGAGSPMVLEQDFNTMWFDMDIGVVSSPFIIDLDQDGLMDVVMGERNGNINFYKNVGSAFDPMFAPLPTIANLGKIDTDLPGQSIGFSTPFFVPTQNGNPMLITGSQFGNLEAYEVTGATADSFPVISETWGNLDEGNRSHPALADLDEDGILEMIVGNLRGGLTLYKTLLADCTVAAREVSPATLSIGLSPNPSDSWVRVTVPAKEAVDWRVVNALGQTLAAGTSALSAFSFSVQDWEPGIYMLEVRSGGQRGVAKVMVK